MRGKFIALNAYIWNDTSSQNNNLSFYIEKIEKGQKPKQAEGRK